MDVMKRLGFMMKPYRYRVAFALFLQLLVILTRMLTPYITKDIVNEVIPAKDLEMLLPLCAALLGMVAVRALSTYFRSVILERTSQNVVFDLRTGLYAHLEELPYSFYDNHRIGEIMSRMTGDIEGVRNFLAGTIVTIFDNLLNFVGALVFLSFMSWQLMLSLLVFAPLMALTAYEFNKRIRPAFRDIREQNAVLNTRTQENLAGVRVVKAFTREDHESQLFEKENQKLLADNLVATRIWGTFVPLMELMSSMCTPVMLIVGGIMLVNGRMDIGTLVAVNGYVWLIMNPMRALSGIINTVVQAITSAEKLFYYWDFGSVLTEKPEAKAPEKYEGHVVFDHVTFSYGGETVLNDISFEAKPGQTIAVMGATGTGKSSLVSLIGRFYDVKSGSVLVDGIDVRDHKLKELRRQLGYVMQETFLFSDSLEDNIRFGRPDAPFEKVRKAAIVAQADEFIQKMPQGYNTVVGERGLGLSGGQKQRVAIARAVLNDPAILIMDDSTSAVDMETEYEIQQQLKDVLKGRTTFIIAHRISSVKNADQILVLDENGTIAERGNHKELLAMKGIYYRMVQDQYKDFDLFAKGKAGEN